MKLEMKAAGLTNDHVGRRILGVPSVAGWEDHLVLREVARRDNGEVHLEFRWDDDPSPGNTRRGEFACGVHVQPDMIVWVAEP